MGYAPCLENKFMLEISLLQGKYSSYYDSKKENTKKEKKLNNFPVKVYCFKLPE